ncbi:MAG: hypothetical protein DRO88_02270 [Promethearchaeia archaeon]|nr:MAG: hypothetical protein DRO88_02270 [Candidatus Lokiarchaeia archaeon]
MILCFTAGMFSIYFIPNFTSESSLGSINSPSNSFDQYNMKSEFLDELPQENHIVYANYSDNSQLSSYIQRNSAGKSSDPLTGENNQTFNSSYSGTTDPLNYTSTTAGQGNYSRFVSLSSTFQNSSQVYLPLPSETRVTSLNLSIDEIWKSTNHFQPINDSIEGTPFYWITYTNNSLNTTNPGDNEYLNWINFTIASFGINKIFQVQIYIDNNLQFSVSDIMDYENYSYAHNFSAAQSGMHFANLTLIYSNLSVYQTIQFPIYHTSNTYSTSSINQIGEITNPYVQIYKEASSSFVSANFTLSTPAYFQELRIFGSYSALFGEFQLTLYPSNGTGPNMSDPITSIQRVNQADLISSWKVFDFSQFSVFLPSGEYYFVLNASGLTFGYPTNYFNLYTTISPADGSQNPLLSQDGLHWSVSSKNFLYSMEFLEYSALDPTNLQLNATIYQDSGAPTERTFLGVPLHINFNSTIGDDLGWPVVLGQFPILFQANSSCLFNFSIDLIVSNQLIGNSTSFTIPYLSSEVQWYGILPEGEIPANTSIIKFKTETFRYLISFPNHWRNISLTFNGSLSFHSLPNNYSVISPYSLLSAEFSAISDNSPVVFDISPSLPFYGGLDEIVPEINTHNTTMLVSLSFWQTNGNGSPINSTYFPSKAQYLDYNHTMYSETINGTLPQLIFPTFILPEHISGDFLTARIWWHNDSWAGSVIAHYPLKNQAFLHQSHHSIDLTLNSSNPPRTFRIRYEDKSSNPISSANVSVSWPAENYSIEYYEEWYYISLFAFSLNFQAGTNRNVSITFSHYRYQTQTCMVQVFFLLDTSFSYMISNTTIFFNQSLTVQGKWYFANGEPLVKQFQIQNYNISAYIDKILIDSSWWFFNSSEFNNDNYNFILRFYTDPFSSFNFIGEHTITLSLYCQNNTAKCEPQIQEITINVKAPPTYLEFIDSSTYSIHYPILQPPILYEFEGYDHPLKITLQYHYLATYLATSNTFLPFRYGSIWGYIFDSTNNLIISNITRFSLISSATGKYYANFAMDQLQPAMEYQIFIFANTTNLSPTQLDPISLEVIPRWNVEFNYHDIVSVVEESNFEFTGRVFFNNGSDQWLASNFNLLAEITFIGADSNETIQLSLKTDSNGMYFIKNIKVPSKNQFNYILLKISAPESRTSVSNSFSIQFEITRNSFQKIFLPLIIIVGIALIGIPVLILIGRRISYRFFRYTPIYATMQNIPLLKTTLKLEDSTSSSSEPQLLSKLNTLRIPLNSEKNWEEITVSPNIVNEPLEGLSMLQFLSRTLKDFQDIFLRGRKSLDKIEFFARKDEIFRRALLYERHGDYYSALILYAIVYEMGRNFHNTEENALLENIMERAQLKLTPKELEHFRRRYRWINTFFRRRPPFQK